MTDWEASKIVQRYIDKRHGADDLLPVEKRLLPAVLAKHSVVLDVGCASGGMYNMMRSLKPDLRYVGVDISATAINYALRRYPGVGFLNADAASLPFEDGAFAFVHSRGLLCHAEDWRAPLREMLRVADSEVMVDIRLCAQAYVRPHGKIPAPMVFVRQSDFEGELTETTFCQADVVKRGAGGDNPYEEAVYLVSV